MYLNRDHNENLKTIFFTYKDIFSHFLCCFKEKKSQRVFKQGYKKIQLQLDVVHVISSLMKLKAGLSAILDNDHEMMEKTKQNYFNDILICSDDEHT